MQEPVETSQFPGQSTSKRSKPASQYVYLFISKPDAQYVGGTGIQNRALMTGSKEPKKRCYKTSSSPSLGQMEIASSQTDHVTYGIRLCPPAPVDLFQKHIEQPPEIQALQKTGVEGEISRQSICHITHS